MKKELNVLQHIQMIKELYGVFFNGFRLFENIIEDWTMIIKQSSPVVRQPTITQLNYEKEQKIEHMVETYQHITDFYEDQSFLFEWDIALAFKWIQERHHQPEMFAVHRWIPFIHHEHLSFKNKANQNLHLPVIGVDSIFEGEATKTVLNGNHRLVEAYQKGKSYLQGYYVRGTVHTQWMTSDLMRDFYEFLLDIKQIDNLLLSGKPFSEKTLYEQLLLFKRV